MAGRKIIYCVVDFGNASRVLKSAGKYGVKDAVISIGRGTVHSRVLEFLKINEIRKEIVTMMVESEAAHEIIEGISNEMAFDKPHHGIAFSYSISEFIGDTNSKDKDTKVNEVRNSMYKAIYVIVDKGKAEEVIEAANKAGARGGTIINARSSGIHEAHKLFSIEIEPEKEKVFIIVENELKDNVVTSIKNSLQLDEKGHGILFILDVDEAYGLHKS